MRLTIAACTATLFALSAPITAQTDPGEEGRAILASFAGVFLPKMDCPARLPVPSRSDPLATYNAWADSHNARLACHGRFADDYENRTTDLNQRFDEAATRLNQLSLKTSYEDWNSISANWTFMSARYRDEANRALIDLNTLREELEVDGALYEKRFAEDNTPVAAPVVPPSQPAADPLKEAILAKFDATISEMHLKDNFPPFKCSYEWTPDVVTDEVRLQLEASFAASDDCLQAWLGEMDAAETVYERKSAVMDEILIEMEIVLNADEQVEFDALMEEFARIQNAYTWDVETDLICFENGLSTSRKRLSVDRSTREDWFLYYDSDDECSDRLTLRAMSETRGN